MRHESQASFRGVVILMFFQAVTIVGSADNKVQPGSLIRKRGRARSSILQAARRVLQRKSYEAVSMGEIADEARLSRRTMYNQFATKEELYRASRMELLAGLAEQVPAPIDARKEPLHAIFEFATQCTKLFADDRHFEIILSLVRDASEHPWLPEHYSRLVRRPLLAALEHYLLHLCVDGRLAAANPINAALQFLCSLEALAESSRLLGASDSDQRFEIEQAVRALIGAFILQHFGSPSIGRNDVALAAA